MYPSGYKASKIYSINPVDGSGDLDFARSSTGTRVNDSGIIETIAIDTPRLDYLGGGCGKLLIEPQRTNTVLSNSDYTQSWPNANVLIAQNATISPNGNNNAQKLTSANTFGQHFLRQIRGGHTVGAPHVFSCFAKAAELDILTLRLFQGGGPNVNFDLTNGTHDGGTNGKMIDFGNGWYRCMTYHPSALSQYLYPYIYTQVGNQQGDGVSGFYAYGAMIEEGTVETSLIDTTTTNVTRTQDTSLTTSSNIAAAINSEEGVLFVDFDRLGLDYEDSWIGLYSSSDSFNNSIRIVYRKDSILAYFRNNSGYQAIMTYYGTWTMPRIKVAFKWKVNDFALWVNGVEGVTDTSGSTFNAGEIDTVNLGDYITSPNPKFNSKINALAVYDTALSDADLTELTTL